MKLFISMILFVSFSLASMNTVTIYTHSSFASPKWGAGPKLKALFEKENPQCEINLVGISGSGALFNRVRLEGEKTKADIVIGLNNFMIDAAKKTNLFSPTNLNQKTPFSPFKYDTFIPYDFATFAFIYDANKLKNPPKSLKELVSREDLRIIYQDPRTSAVGQGFIAWMNSVYKENEIKDAWKTLAKHTITVGKGWSETYGAFLKGEADMVLSYNTSPLYHILNENKDNYKAANFSEIPMAQIDFLAMVKGHESKCANDFMEFMLNKKAQKIISTYNVMLPITNKIGVREYEDLREETLKSHVLSPNIPNKQMKKWIDIWQKTLSE